MPKVNDATWPIPVEWSATTAVGAIIVIGTEGYLLQLRDDRPGIWYPGYWGLFGGALESGETSEWALRRELAEELSLEYTDALYFLSIALCFSAGAQPIHRDIFEVHIAPSALPTLQLREGRQMRIWQARDIQQLRLVPADRLALDFYIHRATGPAGQRE